MAWPDFWKHWNNWKDRSAWPVLLVIMLVGFGLRVAGLEFGLPHDARPDEIPTVQVVLSHLLSPLMLQGDWRLHPHLFNYPSLTYYLLAALYLLIYGLSGLFGASLDWPAVMALHEMDPTLFHMVLRWISVVSGTGVVLGMYLLAKAWAQQEGAGLMAAALAACCYLLVRNAHFGGVDTLLSLGVVFSLWAILRYQREPNPRRLAQACVLIGLTTGVKYPAASLLFPLWIALLQPHVQNGKPDWTSFLHQIWKPTGLVMLVFWLTSPWTLLDFPKFLTDLQYESTHFFTYHLPGLDSGWVFYSTFALYYGLGGLVLACSLLGCWWEIQTRKARWELAAQLGFLLIYALLLGFNTRLMTRYALPLVPSLLLFTVSGLQFLVQILKGLFQQHGFSVNTRLIAVVLVALVSYQSLSLTLAFDGLLIQPDTRALAREWLIRHAAPQTPVAVGPRLGQLVLPAQYGQLVDEIGPDVLAPPSQVTLTDWTPRTRVINTYHDVAVLQALGVRYVVTYQGNPLFSNRPWEFESLYRQARLVYQVSPLKARELAPAAATRFDPMDAFFLPFNNFDGFQRPGPLIQIYELPPVASRNRK